MSGAEGRILPKKRVNTTSGTDEMEYRVAMTGGDGEKWLLNLRVLFDMRRQVSVELAATVPNISCSPPPRRSLLPSSSSSCCSHASCSSYEPSFIYAHNAPLKYRDKLCTGGREECAGQVGGLSAMFLTTTSNRRSMLITRHVSLGYTLFLLFR